MSAKLIELELPTQGIALIRLNRPEAANALNQELSENLAEAFHSLKPDIRAVILTGSGDRAFCAGADLKERNAMDESAWHKQHDAFEKAFHAIRHCPNPIIAAVNGAAYGGGLELALACDFIYASNHARFALTEAALGIMPGLGGTQTLPRIIGPARAKEMLFTGLPTTAEQALQTGLVNRLCSKEELLPMALETAQRIASNAPRSIRAIKRAVQEGATLPLADALQVELNYYRSLLSGADRQEGIAAFNEKRAPTFSGK